MDTEKNFEFPISIARIEIQKKNQMRYSLFSEKEFIIGISETVLINVNIQKGTELTAKLYEQILNEESQWKIRNYLIRLLSRRDHASFELIQKASKKGFDSDVVLQIIEELEEKKYINNEAFAFKFVHDKFEFNKWGSNKIRAELIRKNIPKVYIENAIDQHFGKELVSEALTQLTIKKIPSLLRSSPDKRRKKLFDFLMRKGYDTNMILKEIDALMKLIQE